MSEPGKPSSALQAVGLYKETHEGEIAPRLKEQTFLAHVSWYTALSLSGIGMFIEAYVLITTGQVQTLWNAEYPECWQAGKSVHCPNLIECCGTFSNDPLVNGTCVPRNPQMCNADGTYPSELHCTHKVKNAATYAEFAGIMIGMVCLGLLSDVIGRVRAGVVTSTIAFISVIVMAFYQNSNINKQFTVFAVFFGIYGFGVGGEYPISGTNAAMHHYEEIVVTGDAEEDRRNAVIVERKSTARRGETINMAFAMQGVGATVGSLFVLILIFFAGQTQVDCSPLSGSNASGNNPQALGAAWRAFYFIGGLIIFLVILYRSLILEENDARVKMLAYLKEREERMGKVSTIKVISFYFLRLLGTGGNWFLMDIAFYGLKLFSGPIFSAINPTGSLVANNGYLLVNNIVGLIGYYTCALTVDIKKVGRKNLQLSSFIFNFIVFLISGTRFKVMHTGVLIFLFFVSNYVVNFGANSTTYIMAAETYPVEVRGICHGISAFMGKCGALFATVHFAKITTSQIFFVCAGVNAAGFVCTLLFSADMTGVSLDEHTAQLELYLEGRKGEYKGVLNKPEHLSLFERLFGLHGEYDPNWTNEFVGKSEDKTDHSKLEEAAADQ